MRPIDLNFASVPLRNNTPYYLGYGIGVLIVATFTAFNTWAFFAYSQSRAELESDHAAKRVRLEALYRDAARSQEQINSKNLQAMNSRAAFTNGLLERRRFSWTDLLNSLEEVQPYQVRLQSLIPRIQEKGILIESRGVAKDLKAFWNFQQNLQNHEKFRRVYPGGFLHNSDAGEYIFSLSFNYFPQGAPMNVEGLTPELAGITQAPGPGSGSGRPVEYEEIEEGPPAKEKAAPAKKAPAVRASTPDQKPQPAGPPSAQATQPPRAPAPPAAQPSLDANAQAQLEASRGASSMRPLTTGVNTQVMGTVVPPGGDPNGTAAGARPRWQGRGAAPGSGGKLPPAPQKPAGLPTATVPEKPDPPDDGSADDDEAQKKDEKGEGDEK